MFVGALMGFVGVGLGAFGAHALKGRLSPDMLAVFETGRPLPDVDEETLAGSPWSPGSGL